jgi:hypothetical protein
LTDVSLQLPASSVVGRCKHSNRCRRVDVWVGRSWVKVEQESVEVRLEISQHTSVSSEAPKGCIVV